MDEKKEAVKADLKKFLWLIFFSYYLLLLLLLKCGRICYFFFGFYCIPVITLSKSRDICKFLLSSQKSVGRWRTKINFFFFFLLKCKSKRKKLQDESLYLWAQVIFGEAQNHSSWLLLLLLLLLFDTIC